jgi:hypothetical protein
VASAQNDDLLVVLTVKGILFAMKYREKLQYDRIIEVGILEAVKLVILSKEKVLILHSRGAFIIDMK